MKQEKKYLILIWVMSCFLGGSFISKAQVVSIRSEEGKTDIYEGLEFDMPIVQETKFPDYEVSIVDFGAKGEGLQDNTESINKAIDDVSNNGGGTVLIPRGIWLTGPIVFKSNVNLHADEGALVVFSDDKSKYPLVKTSFEGLETYRCQSPISGRDLENIAITGKGIFDGSGGAWRMVKKSKVSPSQWKQIVASGGVLSEDGNSWYPSENFKKANDLTSNFNVPPFTKKEQFEEVKEFLRPVMVSFVSCKKVLLDGPTFQNSPAWNLHPLMCEDVILRNLTVKNPWYSQNGDGLDLESCKNVLVYNNSFDVGDDAICFKSGKDEDGRKRGMATENVIVKNNIVYHGHGGFVIGSEMSGGVKNVHVSNCTFIGTDVGLRFKSTRGRGGIVENIWISNINMIDIPTEAIRFNMFYGGNSPILEDDQDAETEKRDETLVPVDEKTPIFRNIFLTNITATGSKTAAMFQGLPEMKLENVKLENSVLETQNGMTLIDAKGITFDNVKVLHKKGAALTIYNSKDVDVKQLSFDESSEEPIIKVLGNASDDISLKGSGVSENQLHRGKEVLKGAVTLK